jgi:AcrR family transcriptional regulator
MTRQVDKAAQEDRISEAVWEVLAADGIERLTLRRVAAAADCTTGLVLHRFPNRRELMRHARALLHERTRARVERLEHESTGPRAALRALLAQGMALDPETSVETRVWLGFLSAAFGDEELIADHRRNNRRWQERIIRLVGASDPGLSMDRAQVIAKALIALAEGAGILAVSDRETYDAATQEAMLDLTLARFGLG